jgi:Flp pilus assembly pilin Flp
MWRIHCIINSIKSSIKNFWEEEDGVGVVEIILVLVVLIGLVIIFKSQLTSLVQSIFEKITSESSGI